MQKYVIPVVFFLSALMLAAPGVSAQDKEVDTLISEVSVDTQKGAVFSYTYLMKFSYKSHKGLAGRKFTRFYEAILPSRYALDRGYTHPFVLLKDSERIISDDEILLARKDIAKELERAESEAEKPAPTNSKSDDGGYWTMGFSTNGKRIEVNILEILKKSRLGNLQRQQVEGRSIVAIDFAPNLSVSYAKTLGYCAKMEGRILIDEADRRIIRIEGYAPETFASVKDKPDEERQKEMIFLFLQSKVPEGYWFPLTVRLNFAKHPEIFDPVEIEYNFSNYKKASVDVKDQFESPKKTESDDATKKES